MTKQESKYFKTAKRINLALLELLNKKPLEYITVSELCKKAEVHRSTFYLHYENIGDLLEETTRSMLDDFLYCFSEISNTTNFDFQNCDLNDLNFICDKYMMPYLEYIENNKVLFSTAISNKNQFGLDKVYIRMFENIFNPILERFNYPEADRKYIMIYYLNGIHSINMEWLKDGCQKSIPEVMSIIKTCVFGLNGVLL